MRNSHSAPEPVSCLAARKAEANPNAEAPPQATVVPAMDANNFKVDHPEQFPLATAVEHKAAPELNVTGVVQPDIARAVPVISLATGRVVEIHARLGDAVKKGQLLLRGAEQRCLGRVPGLSEGR